MHVHTVGISFGLFATGINQDVQVVRAPPFVKLLAIGGVELFGVFVAWWAHSDAVRSDVATEWHQGSVGDVVSGEVIFGPTHFTLVPVTVEYDLAECVSDIFLTL